MKKKLILPIALSTLSLLSVLALNIVKNGPVKADAYSYYTASTLPTTIDLNDCTEQEIRAYYQGVENLDGFDLLQKLKTVLSKGQKYFSYDSNAAIWKLYEISDRDWEKSPASSITYGSYNESTKIITGYQYGSNQDPKNNPYIHALYVNRDVDNQVRAWGSHDQDQWGINQEHIWAKKHGFNSNGQGGARGDPMHLMAANGYVNNIHGDNFYGFVNKSKTYTDCGDTHTHSTLGPVTWSNLSNNLLGKSLYDNNQTQSVFEPQDSDKGDIARAIFYMVARYNNYAMDDDNIDQNNPNLEIVNSLSYFPTGGAYNSTATLTGKMGLLADLLEWNKLDPVDEYEIHRNNILFRNYTNNRNPFIDFPQWADAIWGTSKDGVYDYNPTFKVNASTDQINGDKYALSIDKHEVTGVNQTATAKVVCGDVLDVAWSVSDPSIVSLDKIQTKTNEEVKITSLKEGKVVITARITTNEDDPANPGQKKVEIRNIEFRVLSEEPEPTPFVLDIKIMIIIGAVALVLIVILLIVLTISSNARKAANKIIKEANKNNKKQTKTKKTKKK